MIGATTVTFLQTFLERLQNIQNNFITNQRDTTKPSLNRYFFLMSKSCVAIFIPNNVLSSLRVAQISVYCFLYSFQ